MIYGVEGCTIDMAAREVRRGQEAVAVEPQVFDLLLYLIERRTRVVGKDELVEQIWAGRAISDAALSSCIKSARRAIGDDGQQQRLIRTIHSRGFRFVGPVSVEDDLASAAVATELLRAGHAPPAVLEEGTQQDPLTFDSSADDLDLSLPGGPSVAVLPIRLLGDDPLCGLLAEGLTNDITVRLARTRWLFVTARASAARFRGPELDSVEVGRRLGVRYLLRGTLLAADGRLRLTVTLSDAQRGCEIWAERFDRQLDDLFAVQDEIGDLLVSAVEAEIEQKERQRALLQPFASLDAWSAYHRACSHLYRYLPEHHDEAEKYLALAARLDPASARVFAGLSFVHWQRAFLETTRDRLGQVQQAHDYARHSISLDPLDPQGHWALGRALLLDGDFEQAVEELQTSVELNPNFAIGQYSLAFGLMFAGASPEGFDRVAKARRLSPYDPMTFAFLAQRGAMCGLTGCVEEAADWTARGVRQPNAHFHVLAIAAWCHELAGRQEEARSYVARLRAIHPHYCRDDYFRAFPFRSAERAVIEQAFASLGL